MDHHVGCGDLNEKCALYIQLLEYPACDRVCRGGAAFSEEVRHPEQAWNVLQPTFPSAHPLCFLQWLPAPTLPSRHGLFLWNCKPEQAFLHKLLLVVVSYRNDRKVTDGPGEDTVLSGAEFVRTLNGKKTFYSNLPCTEMRSNRL